MPTVISSVTRVASSSRGIAVMGQTPQGYTVADDYNNLDEASKSRARSWASANGQGGIFNSQPAQAAPSAPRKPDPTIHEAGVTKKILADLGGLQLSQLYVSDTDQKYYRGVPYVYSSDYQKWFPDGNSRVYINLPAGTSGALPTVVTAQDVLKKVQSDAAAAVAAAAAAAAKAKAEAEAKAAQAAATARAAAERAAAEAKAKAEYEAAEKAKAIKAAADAAAATAAKAKAEAEAAAAKAAAEAVAKAKAAAEAANKAREQLVSKAAETAKDAGDYLVKKTTPATQPFNWLSEAGLKLVLTKAWEFLAKYGGIILVFIFVIAMVLLLPAAAAGSTQWRKY